MLESEMNALDIHFDDSCAEKYLLEEIDRRRKKYWINRKGERVDITQMDDKYLLNCLNLVRKQSELRDLYWEYRAEVDDYGD